VAVFHVHSYLDGAAHLFHVLENSDSVAYQTLFLNLGTSLNERDALFVRFVMVMVQVLGMASVLAEIGCLSFLFFNSNFMLISGRSYCKALFYEQAKSLFHDNNTYLVLMEQAGRARGFLSKVQRGARERN
jgi:hypothetical protein